MYNIYIYTNNYQLVPIAVVQSKTTVILDGG